MSQESNAEITKKSRMRSPAYPLFGLQEATKKARELWDAQRKNEAHLDSVIHALGYSGRNGASLRAIAALNHYGLIEESGSKDSRRIRLTDLAQDLLHLPDGDEKKSDSLRKAALMPTIHQVLWERYQYTLPNDSTIKAFLVRDRSFNETASLDVIQNYRETFDYAKLGNLPSSSNSDDVNESYDDKTSVVAAKAASPTQVVVKKPPMDDTVDEAANVSPQSQELPILIDDGQIARIPFPMSEEAFDLLIGTLNLWKKRLIKTPHQ